MLLQPPLSLPSDGYQMGVRDHRCRVPPRALCPSHLDSAQAQRFSLNSNLILVNSQDGESLRVLGFLFFILSQQLHTNN